MARTDRHGTGVGGRHTRPGRLQAFYADDHPGYWSLWNSRVETPWVDIADVLDDGGVIICDKADSDCQRLAEAWYADRCEVSVAKSARGFDFPARTYLVYLVAAQAVPSHPEHGPGPR